MLSVFVFLSTRIVRAERAWCESNSQMSDWSMKRVTKNPNDSERNECGEKEWESLRRREKVKAKKVRR